MLGTGRAGIPSWYVANGVNNTYFTELIVDIPEKVANPPGTTGTLEWKDISAGMEHSCGLLKDGSAYCWGEKHVACCSARFS